MQDPLSNGRLFRACLNRVITPLFLAPTRVVTRHDADAKPVLVEARPSLLLYSERHAKPLSTISFSAELGMKASYETAYDVECISSREDHTICISPLPSLLVDLAISLHVSLRSRSRHPAWFFGSSPMQPLL